MATTALELHHISKTFGATKALQDVSLTVQRGEVLALLGENGCGKSTLVKVMAGVYDPEPGGRMVVDGKDVPLPLHGDAARHLGLSFVHQDLGLARPLTVLENLLGGVAERSGSRTRIHWRAEARKAGEMLRSYGVDVDPLAVVNQLPPVEQALVAIARAAEELKQHRERTGASSSVLVLDEPTVFLPEEEVRFLFDLIRTIVASGASVVFISHDLPAVRAIADRVTVLRDGKLAANARMSDVTDAEVVEMIVGPAAAGLSSPKHGQAHGAHRPDAEEPRSFDRAPEAGLHVTGLRGGQTSGLELHVAPGEIVGLAGLLGSGAEEVPYLLFGAKQASGGELTLRGRSVPLTKQHPGQAVGMGLALIPADRRRDAIAPAVSVAENMMLLVVRRFSRGGRLRNALLRSTADERAGALDVRPRRTDLPLGTLSGGNAQKVVVGKWLEIGPEVLLLHEPTQGVDIAARAEIYRAIKRATETGMAVVWVSSDFDELATVCDRVVVVSGGVAVTEIVGQGISPAAITASVYGADPGATPNTRIVEQVAP
ncbi:MULTISPECIES: sugar ABC transporter ATP-binding protein [unclassified Modestobacter]|uniref:sugar ABC transporter ATP-binding protein n=1 Tax=unclassified Modestobacter TaxID=2643866 RepID=UPI0022A9F9E4|nr:MULTISPECIES: sugar ABC transporter ATP-binding protein [unclassified Modestobacter]MCZ2824619.1 sugar ABC transporter ATP-binding protein [Modestobacter sp. VKM Ac-2981]MCZ2854878.1 sugar ABC transporter ATP-binding protein [Modestobacter sp. VKM Ac-2982]